MELKEITQGIYSLNGSAMPIDRRLVVAVHPYFALADSNQKYYEERKKFFKHYKGSVLIFNEEKFFQENVESLIKESKGNIENKFLVKTEFQDPQPINTTWENIFKFSNYFSQPFHFIGGAATKFQESKDYFSQGCLGKCFGKFTDAGFDARVLSDITF